MPDQPVTEAGPGSPVVGWRWMGSSEPLFLRVAEQIERFVAAAQWPLTASIRCLDTGVDTPTGGRLHLAAAHLSGGFCATYADGVADIDLDALLDFHRAH